MAPKKFKFGQFGRLLVLWIVHYSKIPISDKCMINQTTSSVTTVTIQVSNLTCWKGTLKNSTTSLNNINAIFVKKYFMLLVTWELINKELITRRNSLCVTNVIKHLKRKLNGPNICLKLIILCINTSNVEKWSKIDLTKFCQILD